LSIYGAKVSDSFIVRKVSGLEPPDVSLFLGEYSGDGGTYQGRRVGPRNPVFTIDLNPNPRRGETISSLREQLYDVFVGPSDESPYVEVKLFFDNSAPRVLGGYTETFETELFDADTAVQASLVCPDPYIRDVTPTLIDFDPPIQIINTEFYRSSAPCGVALTATVTEDTSNIIFYAGSKSMRVDYDLLENDVVIINSNRGVQTIVALRGLTTINLLPYLTPQSRWLELYKKTGQIEVVADLNTTVAFFNQLGYTGKYWGV